MTYNFDGICIDDKFCFTPIFFTVTSRWFRNRSNCLKPDFLRVKFGTTKNPCCHLHWKFRAFHQSSWNPFWTNKIIQACFDVFRSQHSPYKLACASMMQLRFKPWVLIVERAHCELKELICFFFNWKLQDYYWAAKCCFWTFRFRSLSRDVSVQGIFHFWSLHWLISIFGSYFVFW